jgi:hypothetical protein
MWDGLVPKQGDANYQEYCDAKYAARMARKAARNGGALASSQSEAAATASASKKRKREAVPEPTPDAVAAGVFVWDGPVPEQGDANYQEYCDAKYTARMARKAVRAKSC